MKPTMKALFLSGVLAIATLFVLPGVSQAHWGRPGWGRPWAGYYGSYYAAPYATYSYGYYPGYSYYGSYPGYSYYTPGWTYGYRPYRYYDYYGGYGPRAALRVGPVGVWW